MTTTVDASHISEKDLKDRPDHMQKGRLFGMMLIVVSSIGISFGGLISRSLQSADAWQINIHRSLATIIVVALVLLFRYRRNVGVKFLEIGRPGVFCTIISTIVGITFMQAITTATVANTLFTLSAIPFITAALAWVFLGEKLYMITIITMICAAFGVVIMVIGGIGGGSLYGNVMALITAIGFSTYTIIVRRHRNVDMLPAYLISVIMVCTIALIIKYDDWAISWWDFGLCLIWGGLLSGIGNVLFIIAAKYLYAAEMTLFMLLEFALGPLWVWIFVNEVPSKWTLIGGCLVMSSVVARTLYQANISRRLAVRQKGGADPVRIRPVRTQKRDHSNKHQTACGK